MKFDFKKYIIRVVKFFLYFITLTTIMLTVFVIATKQPFDLDTLLQPGSLPRMGVMLSIFAFIYPLIGFTSQNVYINKPFEEDRKTIEDVFANSRYIVTESTETTITFRHSSSFSRLLNIYEDAIVLDFSDNPLTLTGSRKNVTRFSRMITYAITEREE